MQERRQYIRREMDRDLLMRVRTKEENARASDDKERRHLRRRVIRHNCSLEMALRIQTVEKEGDFWTADECPIDAKLYDLSEDGCLVAAKARLEIDQEVLLTIHLRDMSDIQSLGVIRWTKRIEDSKRIAIGVQFNNIEEESRKRLLAFLQKMERTVGF
ncbi:MAG TPA: PilZ domain-containing protein [Candidatus Hydrogenedentes bacterium]|nr:PilZ domain-containing protein [Candidatus Hydrogenedentota bacterium]